MDSEAACRLALSLSGAGLFLLVLEVWMANYACGSIGAMAILGAIGLAVFKGTIDVAAVILLGATTAISLGVLLMLAYFPNAPLAKILFRHYAERARREAEAGREEDDDLRDGEPGAGLGVPAVPAREIQLHYPPEPLEEELEAASRPPQEPPQEPPPPAKR